jgi:hypothetical protein
MSGVPRLDPSWHRKPPPPPKSQSELFAVAVVIIAALVLWVARREAELRDARQTAQQLTQAASAAASRQVQERLRAEQMPAPSYPATISSGSTATGSFDGREIHRCGYQGTVSYVTGPCPLPWADVGSVQVTSRQQDIYEQANMRAQAEANLRREQQRFNELTGQGGFAAQAQASGYSPASRCAQAKADRDRAYRMVGNNRTFEFIRGWDDYVYNACKNS